MEDIDEIMEEANIDKPKASFNMFSQTENEKMEFGMSVNFYEKVDVG